MRISKFTPKNPDSMGQSLRCMRLSAGLTQKQLAAELGLRSFGSISHYENGTRKIPLNVLERTAGLAGYDMKLVFERRSAEEEK